ncbi:hypothetical protein BT69DRAFT_1291880 [Atractiella rhizophila]|nr:hypothetical protein BT69DRAFT_1291880 [Atractiella rhizophila]
MDAFWNEEEAKIVLHVIEGLTKLDEMFITMWWTGNSQGLYSQAGGGVDMVDVAEKVKKIRWGNLRVQLFFGGWLEEEICKGWSMLSKFGVSEKDNLRWVGSEEEDAGDTQLLLTFWRRHKKKMLLSIGIAYWVTIMRAINTESRARDEGGTNIHRRGQNHQSPTKWDSKAK